MTFSMAFGSATWRYSKLSSEYLRRGQKGSARRCGSDEDDKARDKPGRVVDFVEEFLEACALVVSEWLRLCIATRCVDAHLGLCGHFLVGFWTFVWLRAMRERRIRRREAEKRGNIWLGKKMQSQFKV